MRVVLVAGIVIGCSLPVPTLAADPAFGPPSVLCTVSDPRLTEASGLAVDGSRLLMVNDGGSALEVFVLDRSCRVTSVVTSPVDPYDVEDLARAADGTLWLADTGDNDRDRDTVALHALREDGQSVLFRFTYPDGQQDAEALLLDRAGRPFVLTKEPQGRAGIYTPAAPPSVSAPTALERVGSLTFAATGTPGGPLGQTGQVLITGAAMSPDGALAVVRTYTDAYVYAVTDGDVLAALAGEPVRVSLPPAPQGEAIAFAANGRDLLVTSEGTPFDVTVLPAAASSGSAAVEAVERNSTGVNLAIAAVVAAVLVGFYGLLRRRS
ncbi:MAG: hypothetical protein WKF47_08330 [Geodermatophilaceae bacterium]